MAYINVLSSIAMQRLLQILPAALLLFHVSAEGLAQRQRTDQTASPASGLLARVQTAEGAMQVYAQWSAQPGVSKFRFQLARDDEFSDIVVDRVVSATETRVSDLAPGKYFWRVAPLICRLGEFSSPRAVDASYKSTRVSVLKTMRPEARWRQRPWIKTASRK